tara:strand:- start:29 stop:1090 length:1062 start_codon:yes stop_codon:yes gene_type:complete
MGKMMNFGRTTPLTTDPQGRRIADPAVYGKKIGTGAEQRTVGSWPEARETWRKTPADQRYDYGKDKNSQVANYMLGKTDYIDDVNIEEPTYQGGKGNMANFGYTLKKDSPRYKYAQGEYGQPYNRERTKLQADSGMSQQEWLKQPDAVRYSKNILDLNPLGEGMQYDFPTEGTVQNYSSAPGQTHNIRSVKKKDVAKPTEVAKPVIMSKVQTPAVETEVTAPIKKEVISKKDLEIKNLPLLKVGKIATQQGRIKRIVDPNEPEYKGAGMLQDTKPKAQKVQQATGYNEEKRSEAIRKSYETGQRMEFTGGAINKKDLGYQSRYNKQYDKFQAEKDKNPMNNKTLELFYNKRFK